MKWWPADVYVKPNTKWMSEGSGVDNVVWPQCRLRGVWPHATVWPSVVASGSQDREQLYAATSQAASEATYLSARREIIATPAESIKH